MSCLVWGAIQTVQALGDLTPHAWHNRIRLFFEPLHPSEQTVLTVFLASLLKYTWPRFRFPGPADLLRLPPTSLPSPAGVITRHGENPFFALLFMHCWTRGDTWRHVAKRTGPRCPLSLLLSFSLSPSLALLLPSRWSQTHLCWLSRRHLSRQSGAISRALQK